MRRLKLGLHAQAEGQSRGRSVRPDELLDLQGSSSRGSERAPCARTKRAARHSGDIAHLRVKKREIKIFFLPTHHPLWRAGTLARLVGGVPAAVPHSSCCVSGSGVRRVREWRPGLHHPCSLGRAPAPALLSQQPTLVSLHVICNILTMVKWCACLSAWCLKNKQLELPVITIAVLRSLCTESHTSYTPLRLELLVGVSIPRRHP